MPDRNGAHGLRELTVPGLNGAHALRELTPLTSTARMDFVN